MSAYNDWKWAIDAGNYDGCRMLLRRGTDVNSRAPIQVINDSPHLATPLHRAVRFNEEGIAYILLDSGADPFWAPKIHVEGYLTAFQMAVEKGRESVVRYILDHFEVDLEQRTLAGQTLFELAKSPAVAGLLLSKSTEQKVSAAIMEQSCESEARNVRKSAGMPPL